MDLDVHIGVLYQYMNCEKGTNKVDHDFLTKCNLLNPLNKNSENNWTTLPIIFNVYRLH